MVRIAREGPSALGNLDALLDDGEDAEGDEALGEFIRAYTRYVSASTGM